MSSRRIWNILKKEWAVMSSDLNSALFVTLLPLLIVGQAILLIWLIAHFGGEAIVGHEVFQTALRKLAQAVPSAASLSTGEQLQVLLLSQFNFYLLLIPTMIAVSFATFSIVEEKMSRSLEPLLATPVRTGELLLGKALSGALPALVVTWACAGVFVLATIGLGWGQLLAAVLNPSWYISLFLLTPAVALLSFMLGVIGSSRAKDPRSAQNFSIVIILPVLALIGVQVTGLVWFSTLPALALALGLAAADLLVLRVATRLFQREAIVVRWR